MTITAYERAIAETMVVDGQKVLRLFPVDGREVFDQEGNRVPCWNGLSNDQQRMLINGHYGERVRHGEAPDRCDQYAGVMVEFPDDETPGPRMYCLDCAALHLLARLGWEPLS